MDDETIGELHNSLTPGEWTYRTYGGILVRFKRVPVSDEEADALGVDRDADGSWPWVGNADRHDDGERG